MTTEYQAIVKNRISGNLIKYGIGDDHDFTWDPALSESENTSVLDLRAITALFKQPKMTFDLKKGGFDLGIGGPGFADSLFFRDMQIPFIKLIPEDIESHTLHRQLGIPVL